MNQNDNYNMGNHPCFSPDMMQDNMANGLMYPELYYKMQPHVMTACDEMELYGCMMPTRESMMCMCDRVCNNLFRMYPDMAQYDIEYPSESMTEPQVSQFGRYRRSPFRDFIYFLLLSEILRRRRRYY